MTLTIITSLAALALFGLWQHEKWRGQRRERLWREALAALAVHDFAHAESLLGAVDGAPPGPVAALVASDKSFGRVSPRRALETLGERTRALETARHDLEDVLSSLQDAVIVVDAESRLRFVNQAALEFFEVRVADVLGAYLLEALPSFGLDSAVRAALSEGRNTEQDISLYTPQARSVFLRVTPLHHGNGQGAVAILQDLTHIRRLERVRRDFVANASHELRAPLATIRATAETIVDSPEDPVLVARYGPHLVSEAERLSRLVNDLLHLARAEAHAEEPRDTWEEVNLLTLMYDVIGRFADKAMRRHIEVLGECKEDVFVRGDAGSLEQVVVNLLDNAIIYTPEGGSVTLRCGHTPEGKVSLEVSDTGIGIAGDDLPRIFERFYRVDKVRSRAQGGTGLGLAIVRHIVENHQGNIKVESAEGKGTTFTVTLPGA